MKEQGIMQDIERDALLEIHDEINQILNTRIDSIEAAVKIDHCRCLGKWWHDLLRCPECGGKIEAWF